MCWLCFWYLCLLFLFCFFLVLVLLSQTMKNTVFPAILGFFSHVGYKVVFICFQFHVLVLVCFFCVVCFHFRQLICIILCLCRLVFFLEAGRGGLLFAYCSLLAVFVVLFWIVFFCFSFLSKNDPKTQQKTKRNKHKCRKNGPKNKSVSAVVFTNSVPNFLGVGFKNADFCWKHYKNSGFNIFWKKKEKRLKKRVMFVFFFIHIFWKSHSPCRKKRSLTKTKKEKTRELGPSSDSKEGYFWTKFWLYYIYIWLTNRTGESRTGEPRPPDWTLSWALPWTPSWDVSWESLKGWKQGNQPSWVLSWALSWAHSWVHSWAHSWCHSWTHSWVEVRFRLLCASPNQYIYIYML